MLDFSHQVAIGGSNLDPLGVKAIRVGSSLRWQHRVSCPSTLVSFGAPYNLQLMATSRNENEWYTSSKATLRPLVAFSEEGFELESRRLCGRYEQLAADCVAAKQHKGMLYTFYVLCSMSPSKKRD